MVRQFRVRTGSDRTRATAARGGRRLLARAIDAGTRDLPHTRNARQTITARKGGRECPAHRLDLLEAKGRLPSRAAILAYNNSLSMVISPTLDFSRAISSSRSSRSRSFKAVAPPQQARDRATRPAWRRRHWFAGPPDPAARRAIVARRSPSCAERKNASGRSHRRPKGRLRQLWGSAPAPLRACALHHSSCLTLRLRFNLPQPAVSTIRAAPHMRRTDRRVGIARLQP